ATHATLGQNTFLAHLASTFHRYTELDTPCTIEAHPLPGHAGQRRVRILAHQNDTPVFTATTGTGPHPA
ncbi:ScbA/BarX family gamma-butyrolactone biosynthesis protein, partial [Streptomyces sp. NPDC005046]